LQETKLSLKTNFIRFSQLTLKIIY